MGIAGNVTCDLADLHLHPCTDLVSPWAWCFPADGYESKVAIAPTANVSRPGICLCSYYQGFEGPRCDERTASADANLATLVSALLLCVFIFGFALKVRATKKVARKTRKKTQVDNALDAVVVSWLLFAVELCCSVLDNLQISPSFQRAREVAIFVAYTATVVTWLLVALGWIGMLHRPRARARPSRA